MEQKMKISGYNHYKYVKCGEFGAHTYYAPYFNRSVFMVGLRTGSIPRLKLSTGKRITIKKQLSYHKAYV